MDKFGALECAFNIIDSLLNVRPLAPRRSKGFYGGLGNAHRKTLE